MSFSARRKPWREVARQTLKRGAEEDLQMGVLHGQMIKLATTRSK
ncbi:Anaerobic selenocysteine-containing dehydrogenase [Pseudomonas syringae pv. actinidiae]|uniref:Anaerobic selenocysteine-containing dehydrogenase n=1 Tax=Pseudomonas syringae pv. actinidiae TaxID=103796 RepID=A0A2V0QD89_PSESF|nr:Anaerobic selenocysteine-containing dehydrogenase [Pseudomonas syringae pv. actinidiae]GBH15925.1 Anaerobic selenocysteine-containing dehydrogenase [Pseudomonas syringae pv. actinidiae]